MALETCTLNLLCTGLKKHPSAQKEHRRESLKKVEKGPFFFLKHSLNK